MDQEQQRNRELEDAPEVREGDPGGELAGPDGDTPAEDRPEHVRPTSETQEKTDFISAPESGASGDD